MFNIHNTLHCETYYELVDYHYIGQDDLPSGIIHVDIQAIPEFFNKIKFNNKNYIVVSSRSDYGIAYQEDFPPWRDLGKWLSLMAGPEKGYQGAKIFPRLDAEKCNEKDKYSIRCWAYTSHTFPDIPNNIKKWFSTNCHITNDNRLIGIPFGANVTDGKIDGLKQIIEYNKTLEQNNLLYLNCSLNNTERIRLYEFYDQHDFVICKNNVKPSEYLDDLASHKFCICPNGNGVDCYRTWECLLIGCIPIVEANRATSHLMKYDLPILYVQTLLGLRPYELELIYQDFKLNWQNFNWKILSNNYWKDIFESYRHLL